LSLLKFSRTAKLEFQAVSLNALIREALDLTANQSVLQKVKVIYEPLQEDVTVNADPTMLRQALFNLCINAFDAMPSGGELRVRMYSGERTSDICIDIADTGEGMPEPVLRRIFDPFFTTKETGKGTGLGLTIVHLIIQRHEGSISVESQVNKGAKFTVTLPRASAAGGGCG
jgi:two-component system NtrC family sensor kinase